MFRGVCSSPIGDLLVESNGSAVTSIQFRWDKPIDETTDEVVDNCIVQLNEYFSGLRKTFDIALSPDGTDFQQNVWDMVSHVPYGETTSYGAIAQLMGDAKLNRAVGLANGANPIPIIIPCHRIVGSDGSLTGYAGGLEIKKWLLNHEAKNHTIIKGQLKLF